MLNFDLPKKAATIRNPSAIWNLPEDPCRFIRQVNKLVFYPSGKLFLDPCRFIRQVNQFI